ncbi:MAG TPA: L-rhamnose isomerase [Verrucomicrobiae bacterium]
MPTAKKHSNAFELAREIYSGHGVDVEEALTALAKIPISLHCWQGDDVRGFENVNSAIGGGLAVTGNYPGAARTPEELRADFETALRMIPGRHRFSLHASYGEFAGKKVDRDEIEPKHFRGWIDWAKGLKIGLDFNQTCFAHSKANDGFTLAHPDKGIRDFWIEHCRRAREIGATIGKALTNTCITNLWVPDGFKDTPADRKAARERLLESLDAVFKKKLPAQHNLDAVEPKLFGIGAESCTVGSHEFYLGYAITRKKLLCLDAGHYHPTETISDKISSVLQFLPEILLHVSRGVRWDSDHVVTLSDDLSAIAREIVANDYTDRVHIGLDYFDASINRIAAWVIGARNMQRALLLALLEPPQIKVAERVDDKTARLALQEEAKALPFGLVWDEFCARKNVPDGDKWLREVRAYEERVLSKRN